MVIETLAVAAIAIFKVYLAHAGEGFAEKTGEKFADKATELYQVLRKKLSTDPYASQTLERAEQKPQDADRLAALESVLKETLAEDSPFAEVIDQIVREAKASDRNNVVALGERSMAIGANATGVFNTGDDAQINK